MSAEDNKALVRRLFEAQNEGNLEAIDELLAPDFVDHSLFPGQEPGREGYKQSVVEDLAAHSVLGSIIEDQIAQGDKVVTRVTSRGIYDSGNGKAFAGVAPDGQEHEQSGIVIHRISGDKIVEEWSEASTLASLMERRLEEEARERERVEQELQVARRIQQATLPRTMPTLVGWEIAHHYQPAREVGGDFYDFHLLSEGKLGLAVGDATGKGVPAALVMATTCGMLRLAAQSYSSSGEMLQRVNEALFPNIPTNMFVTCFYGILDPKSGTFTYANAGHDVPYLHRRRGHAEELRARGMPLGLTPGVSYEQKQTILQAGEAALFYSDGLVEAHDPQREMFGFPRLQALVSEHGEEERSLEETLLEELYSFVGEGWEQEDDITLLTLRRSASVS
jgi:serine phosphatase RsbU (regulator of sigma subunit)/ketosteroid isomerase-like protein